MANNEARGIVYPPDVIKSALDVASAVDLILNRMANHLVTPYPSSELVADLNAVKAAAEPAGPTCAETFEAVRAAGGEHKADCDCDRCVQARVRNAAEPAGGGGD